MCFRPATNYFKTINPNTLVVVNGSLVLEFEFPADALPKNICTNDEDFILRNNSNITALDINITTTGNVTIYNLSQLKSISGVIKGNQIIFDELGKLEYISAIINAKEIMLRIIPNFTGFKSKINVEQLVAISSGTIKFTSDSVVKSLFLYDNISTYIPFTHLDELYVKSQNINITSEGLTINKKLTFIKYDLNPDIFEKITVNKDLIFLYCRMGGSLGIHQINGSLTICCDLNIIEFSDNLRVNGNVSISGLNTLPNNFRVLGDECVIKKGNGDFSIPDDFYFKDHLVLESCNISELPLSWLRTLVNSDSNFRVIDLVDMPISDEDIALYNRISPDNLFIQRRNSRRNTLRVTPSIKFSNHEKAIKFWINEATNKNLKISLLHLYILNFKIRVFYL
jgi:hypothetical protein